MTEQLAATIDAGEMNYWNIFGLDVAQAGYQGTILPILVIAWILATIEKFLHKHLKGTVDFMLTPLLTLLVTGFITFIAVGPVLRTAGDMLGAGLNDLYTFAGPVGGFIFGVYLQNVSAGAYVSTLTLVTGLPEVLISLIKALTFGLIAGLVGCYRGLTVAGGAKGVGTAVNETLVLCVIALFAVNVVLTTIGVRFGTGS